MDKKISGLLGAAAALTTMSVAQSAIAEPTPNTPPASYRDLLEPGSYFCLRIELREERAFAPPELVAEVAVTSGCAAP
jgi:hypothetical protein